MGSMQHDSLAQDQDHSSAPDDLSFPSLPPFPTNVPTAPLIRINLHSLLANDPTEEENLWRACVDAGFFYLDLRSFPDSSRDKTQSVDSDALLSSADALFDLGERVFDLPEEEKLRYDFAAQGSYFGYKGFGAGVVDAKGTRDGNEFWNVSKDDILGVSKERLPAPEVLDAEESRELLRGFMVGSHDIVAEILRRLNSRLDLPEGKLQSLHRLRVKSGDQVRWVKAPPAAKSPSEDTEESHRRLALGEHTDFGSVTVLFNRLGGLQVLLPGEEEWAYVRPLRGHCVVNLGDAMVKFTNGVVRSNIHRVVNPPPPQDRETRYSLVYFARPEDDVLLKALDGSELIDRKRQENGNSKDEEVTTAKEWILRRALGRRVGGNFTNSEGTESRRLACEKSQK